MSVGSLEPRSRYIFIGKFPDFPTMWYLDCYSWNQASGVGREFPANSYYSESLEVLIGLADRLLGLSGYGIDEVRISKETRGLVPQNANLLGERELND